MDVLTLLDTCQPVINRIAQKYKIRGNILVSAEDLVQEQVAKVLEIAANPPLHETDDQLVRYTLTACRRTCLCIIRDDWRKAGRKVASSLDDCAVAEFVSDGTYELLRQRMEKQERNSLLTMLLGTLRNKHERLVLQEIISPGPVTCNLLESGATLKEALSSGSGVSIPLVRKSLTEIRKVLSHAA